MNRSKIFVRAGAIAAFSAFLMVGGCGGDNPSNPSHTHNYGPWETVTGASCQADGQRKRDCSCGDIQIDPIPRLSGVACDPSHTHSYGSWVVVTAATCQTDGQEKRTCGCGDAETRVILKSTVAGCGGGGGSGTFTDNRDDKTYKYVTIGSQVWMAENLNYSGSSNNTGVCYNNSPDSCAKYGRLYDWATVMVGYSSSSSSPSGVQGICPSGWHVPSDAEWTTLTSYVGPSTAGTKLKAKSGWDIDWEGNPYNGNGTDDYGFSALPGGYGGYGDFSDAGYGGGWWSATEIDANYAWNRYVYYYYEHVGRGNNVKTLLFSLRCLRD